MMDSRIPPIDQEDLVRIRRELHAHPELGWDLTETSALVRRELDKAGIPYEADKYGKNTVVATINPEKTGFTLGLRADMDALPIRENNEDKPYRSQNDGVMHACGHDAHTAMLIGTARALYEIRDRIPCRVRLLFQPCEEGRPSGARIMCEHGVMDDIDAIVMCHVNCLDETHVISSCPGTTNATSVAWKAVLGGKSVHVASPHMGKDALAAGVKIYNGIQTILGREVDPFDTCVMAVCKMHAGTTVSANADECVMEGSIRCLRDDTMVWARAPRNPRPSWRRGIRGDVVPRVVRRSPAQRPQRSRPVRGVCGFCPEGRGRRAVQAAPALPRRRGFRVLRTGQARSALRARDAERGEGHRPSRPHEGLGYRRGRA